MWTESHQSSWLSFNIFRDSSLFGQSDPSETLSQHSDHIMERSNECVCVRQTVVPFPFCSIFICAERTVAAEDAHKHQLLWLDDKAAQKRSLERILLDFEKHFVLFLLFPLYCKILKWSLADFSTNVTNNLTHLCCLIALISACFWNVPVRRTDGFTASWSDIICFRMTLKTQVWKLVQHEWPKILINTKKNGVTPPSHRVRFDALRK